MLERKNAFLGYEKKEVQKVEKLTFSQRAKPMVFVQKWPCFEFFLLGNIGQENVFYDILEQKNAFRGYKNKKFKKSKNWHFLKGVNPWFWSKNGHFATFFFRQYRPGKWLLRNSRTKKRLSRLEKQEVQKVEKWPFFQRGLTHPFFPKMTVFPTFFLKQYRPGKCLLRYSRKKKRLSRL